MLWLLAIIAGGFEPAVITDHIDQIELNHFYDEQGRHVFDQLIFRKWRGDDFEIVAWKLVKSYHESPVGQRVVYHDGQVIRKIVTISTITTWTQFDPELEERKCLPSVQRRELSRPASLMRARVLLQKP